jgi:predicted CxxxxCH...CXXCH cytochrome family protein
VNGNQHAQVALSGGGGYNPGGSIAGTDGGIFNYTAGTCNSNACHHDGQGGLPNDTATWGTALPVTCIGCHNNDLDSTEPMVSNAHNVHVSDATVMSIKPCQTCHVNTIAADNRTIVDKFLHINTVKDVSILDTWDDVTANPDDNYIPGVGCDSIYCHSNGQSSLTYNPVSWTTTIGCNGCHDDAGIASNLTGAHLAHIGTDPSDSNKQFGYGCTICHVQTAASNSAIGTVANHINKVRDVSVNSTYGGDDAIDTDYTGAGTTVYDDADLRWPQAIYTCDNTLCHGSGSPQWTVGTVTGDCSTCHGMSKTSETAPLISVMDTEGHTADSDRQVGAHSTHLNALNNYSAPISCDNCHNTTVNAMASKGTYVEKVQVASHNDTAGPAEITFANIATKFATQPAVYAPGTANCNVYCHGGVNVGMLAGANNNPGWDQNAYLTGVSTAAGDCSRCHYSPPPGKGHLGNEEIVWTNTGPKSCGTGNCHDEVMDTDGSFKDKTLHVNGVTNTTATCTTCHITMPPNTGSHQKHYVHLEQDLSLFVGLDVQPTGDGSVWNEANYPLCASCHDMNDEANDHFGDTSQIMGVNKKSETFSNTPKDFPEFDDVDKNCYNVRCHFQATPDWYSPTTWPSWP